MIFFKEKIFSDKRDTYVNPPFEGATARRHLFASCLLPLASCSGSGSRFYFYFCFEFLLLVHLGRAKN